MTYALPARSTAIAVPTSFALPPRYVDQLIAGSMTSGAERSYGPTEKPTLRGPRSS